MRSLPPGRDRDGMMQDPAVEGLQNHGRSSALLRLFGDLVLSSSVRAPSGWPLHEQKMTVTSKFILHHIRWRAGRLVGQMEIPLQVDN
jgi:hypothetical protein